MKKYEVQVIYGMADSGIENDPITINEKLKTAQADGWEIAGDMKACDDDIWGLVKIPMKRKINLLQVNEIEKINLPQVNENRVFKSTII